ncbi:AAA family ATPase [Rudaeicoccus suwonensis]|uniref:MoxR-like ATPase n=1 Tax=Rudaeicoccus suwonensis TaxID=657409 RepID=A0A561ECC2_9MICO|nr:AAA family ATPase [Rudaeicoccus suwonensis]TWE13249.1 MoxR-like ATPase [Rudaeicoccus suwonensis]
MSSTLDTNSAPVPDTGDETGGDIAEVQRVGSAIARAVSSVIEGKDDVIRTAVIVLLAQGHLLIEDVPGVGKTMLAKALARAIDAPMRRIQFTPDLLPSDITGVSVFNQDTRTFEFRPGAIFANIVVGDEINRASPKTQSALLECMEEDQVTVDGRTYRLRAPFMVMATQNPIEMEGTYPLPEAQRDRFMARISMGYPTATAELQMLEVHGGGSPLDAMAPVTDEATVRRCAARVGQVHASPALRQYIVDLVGATRNASAFRLGASPRASLQLLRAARALAALAGRDHVIPEDVQALIGPVLAHRVILSSENQHLHKGAGRLLLELAQGVPVPASRR